MSWVSPCNSIAGLATGVVSLTAPFCSSLPPRPRNKQQQCSNSNSNRHLSVFAHSGSLPQHQQQSQQRLLVSLAGGLTPRAALSLLDRRTDSQYHASCCLRRRLLGTLRFHWDNSFSWFRAKTVQYRLSVKAAATADDGGVDEGGPHQEADEEEDEEEGGEPRPPSRALASEQRQTGPPTEATVPHAGRDGGDDGSGSGSSSSSSNDNNYYDYYDYLPRHREPEAQTSNGRLPLAQPTSSGLEPFVRVPAALAHAHVLAAAAPAAAAPAVVQLGEARAYY
jgi:hypothetical protein